VLEAVPSDRSERHRSGLVGPTPNISQPLQKHYTDSPQSLDDQGLVEAAVEGEGLLAVGGGAASEPALGAAVVAAVGGVATLVRPIGAHEFGM